MKCRRCRQEAEVALPSHTTGFCRECYFLYFRRQIERAIKKHGMFGPQDKILVALSGGKDSLALMYELADQGYDVTGLHVYLGIGRSSEQARHLVESFCAKHGFKLMIADMPAEGLAIPEVKECISRPICSVCGKIKRHYFNRIALEHGFTALATGHNLDDEVARLFANTLRWDAAYLSDQGPTLSEDSGFARKVKPLYRLTEFETAAYSFLRGIDYGVDPCPYSSGASFTSHKALWETLEEKSPGSKIHFYDGFLKSGRKAFQSLERESGVELSPCGECGSPTSGEICGVCLVRRRVQARRQNQSATQIES
ncbi:ATP-binding protein [Desulfocurvibacter africanus]|uniref:ATP-binding protein n=1 Tax=Desulfocurvibacter africanus TaxID=873 RepID=UPI00041D3074|nr:ATP-binding protein [Desulfocurvibacter africanus]